MENAETEVWLDFAKDCKYLAEEKHEHLFFINTEVSKLLAYMIMHPEKYINNN